MNTVTNGKKEQASGMLTMRAASNLEALRRNPYPGRVIIVGLDETGKNLVQIYAIMGRSANSRNRVFEHTVGRLSTAPADPSKVEDPSLIIYDAMIETRYGDDVRHVVSNGHQTASIATDFREGVSLLGKLRCWSYEPDKPNFTPRITACSSWEVETPYAWISLLRKSPWGNECDRHLYEINNLGNGFGYFISTYSGDGDPLPSFVGEPQLMPLIGNIDDIAKTYWGALDADNRVSLAVKFIPKNGPSKIVVINKYSKVD